MLANTYRRRLRTFADNQYGFVTTHDALQLGIPAVELRKLASRGGLEQVWRSVYRFSEVPHTANDRFMKAVLCVGPDAYLVGESVLALHELAMVNPRAIQVSAPRRFRAKLPSTIKFVAVNHIDETVTRYEGIASMSVSQALYFCRGAVMGSRLNEAIDIAAQRGLLHRAEIKQLRTKLRDPVA